MSVSVVESEYKNWKEEEKILKKKLDNQACLWYI